MMTKARLFQDRILSEAERLAFATGAATYRWGHAKKGQLALQHSLTRNVSELLLKDWPVVSLAAVLTPQFL
jgi:hypothetical protein